MPAKRHADLPRSGSDLQNHVAGTHLGKQQELPGDQVGDTGRQSSALVKRLRLFIEISCRDMRYGLNHGYLDFTFVFVVFLAAFFGTAFFAADFIGMGMGMGIGICVE